MWTTIAVIAVILLYFIAVYNGLIARRNQVREAWATVDTQLKRRYDLIPNLIETVRGAAKHERETLGAVTDARTAAMAATGPSGADAQNKLTETLKSRLCFASMLTRWGTRRETLRAIGRRYTNTIISSVLAFGRWRIIP